MLDSKMKFAQCTPINDKQCGIIMIGTKLTKMSMVDFANRSKRGGVTTLLFSFPMVYSLDQCTDAIYTVNVCYTCIRNTSSYILSLCNYLSHKSSICFLFEFNLNKIDIALPENRKNNCLCEESNSSTVSEIGCTH